LEKITVKKEINTSVKDTAEIDLEAHLIRAQPLVKELFLTLENKILELDENIQEKVKNNYIAFKISKIFAELHLQKSRILIHLRPVDYNDPKGKIQKVPDSHNWALSRKLFIDDKDDIDYVTNIIEQSYQDVL